MSWRQVRHQDIGMGISSLGHEEYNVFGAVHICYLK